MRKYKILIKMKLFKWVQSVAVVAGETQISALSLVFGERVRERERGSKG